jgi:hypothetical protein
MLIAATVLANGETLLVARNVSDFANTPLKAARFLKAHRLLSVDYLVDSNYTDRFTLLNGPGW